MSLVTGTGRWTTRGEEERGGEEEGGRREGRTEGREEQGEGRQDKGAGKGGGKRGEEEDRGEGGVGVGGGRGVREGNKGYHKVRILSMLVGYYKHTFRIFLSRMECKFIQRKVPLGLKLHPSSAERRNHQLTSHGSYFTSCTHT